MYVVVSFLSLCHCIYVFACVYYVPVCLCEVWQGIGDTCVHVCVCVCERCCAIVRGVKNMYSLVGNIYCGAGGLCAYVHVDVCVCHACVNVSVHVHVCAHVCACEHVCASM